VPDQQSSGTNLAQIREPADSALLSGKFNGAPLAGGAL